MCEPYQKLSVGMQKFQPHYFFLEAGVGGGGLFCFVLPHRSACKILGFQPGIEPASPVVEMQSINHWTAREVPTLVF